MAVLLLLLKLAIPYFWMLLIVTHYCAANQEEKENSSSSSVPAEKYHFERNEYVRSTELKDKVRYLLYDRSKGSWEEIPRSGQVHTEIWLAGGDLKVIAHGFGWKTWQTWDENMSEQQVFKIGTAYGKSNDSINVITVDWLSLSMTPLLAYPTAARSTPTAGLDVAEFLVKLKELGYLKDWSQVHIIGFSLGAHVAGAAGYQVQKLTGGDKIGRITGLDPAGPEFDKHGGTMPEDITGFLEKSDASFVDIIHCNMGQPPWWLFAPILFGRLGSYVQAGHADFYPDGGETQGSCSMIADRTDEPCSHHMCMTYFAQSIKDGDGGRLACPCESWQLYQDGKCDCKRDTGGQMMGDKCESSASGKYYLNMT